MFGISLPEFLIIACIAIVLIKPKDIPTIAKYSKIIFKKINYFKKEASKLYCQIHEALIDKDEIKEEQNFIQGDDGKIYEAFNIDDLKSTKKTTKSKKKKLRIKT
jgi:Sec-independent protein translocase protein TatA